MLLKGKNSGEGTHQERKGVATRPCNTSIGCTDQAFLLTQDILTVREAECS